MTYISLHSPHEGSTLAVDCSDNPSRKVCWPSDRGAMGQALLYLRLPRLPITPTQGQQRAMGTGLDHAPAVHHADVVSLHRVVKRCVMIIVVSLAASVRKRASQSASAQESMALVGSSRMRMEARRRNARARAIRCHSPTLSSVPPNHLPSMVSYCWGNGVVETAGDSAVPARRAAVPSRHRARSAANRNTACAVR
jgi:hypothetical protein